MFRTLDEKVLKEICQSLQPVMFTEDTYIVKEGKPLDKMLFITQGIVWSYGSSNNNGSTRCLKKGDFYGEELLNWVSEVSYLTALPISTRFVKSHTHVEAFVLRAYDLKTIVSKNWLHFSKFTPPSQKQHLAASSLQESWRRHHEKRARAVHLAQLREMGNNKITDEVPLLGQFK
nr:cyclic nucleotide-gated ion channel 1-like [Malus domestica]